MLHKEVTDKILKAFYTVYNALGYGFLEKVYENALMIELKKEGFSLEQQKKVEVFYESQSIGIYFSDVIVDDIVVLELKASEALCKANKIQLQNYLKATHHEVGLLLNFGKKPDFERVVFSNRGKNVKPQPRKDPPKSVRSASSVSLGPRLAPRPLFRTKSSCGSLSVFYRCHVSQHDFVRSVFAKHLRRSIVVVRHMFHPTIQNLKIPSPSPRHPMFLLGHLGIATAVVFLAREKYRPGMVLDFRLIAILAMLPDIIDKTLGHIIFKGELDNGRLVAHSFLFFLLLTLFLRWRFRANWQFLTISGALHLLLDRMWGDLSVLLWPLLGWEFEAKDWNVSELYWELLTEDPWTVGGEVVGGAFLLGLVWYCGLFRKERLLGLLRSGNLAKYRTGRAKA